MKKSGKIFDNFISALAIKSLAINNLNFSLVQHMFNLLMNLRKKF